MNYDHTALILVDLQNDFVPGGSLAVEKGDDIIPLINALLQKPFGHKIATKDWHPSNHGSFASQHGKNPGEIIILNGIQQILWPDHCIQHTSGSDFVPGLDVGKIEKIIYKGTDPGIDSYSTFFDNDHQRSTGLKEYLREKGVTHVFIAGLATDYCVKYSVLDAVKSGFKTYVIKDACRGVNLKPEDSQLAFNEMQRIGASIITTEEAILTYQQPKEL